MKHIRLASHSVSGHWFWAIAAAASLLVGALLAAYGMLDRRAMLAAGEHSAREIAEHTALATGAALDANRQLLGSLRILATAAPTAPPGWVRGELLRLKAGNADIMDLLLVDAVGRIAEWTGDGTPPAIADREYFRVHLRSPASGLYLGEPLLSKVHQGRWFFPMSEALRDERGRLLGVAVAIIDVAMLHDLVSVPGAIDNSTQVLLSANGRIYTRNPDHERHVGRLVSRPDELAAATPGDQTVTVRMLSELDRRVRIVSFRGLRKFPLIAVGSVDLETLMEPWLERMAMLAALWLLLSAAIVWLARRAKRINDAQADLACIDGLTGAYNRRSILHAARMIERNRAHRGELAILMVDVDHFKSINDRFGHPAGDEVLRRISAAIRRNLRASDAVGRYGGEEFIVLMPDTGAEGAARAAENIRAAVAAEILAPAPVTISIGVAILRREDAFDEAQGRADAALYAAKASGRNRVCAAACASAAAVAS